MTWEQAYKTHAVHSIIRAILSLEPQSRERASHLEPPEEAEALLDRTFALANQVNAAVAATPPLVADPRLLGEIQTPLEQARVHLERFAGDGNVRELSSVISQLFNVMRPLSQLAYPKSVEEVSGFAETVTSLRRSSGQLVRNLRKEVRETKQTAQKLNGELESLRSDIAELEKAASNQKTQLDNLSADFQRQFSEAEDRRRQEFEETTKNLREKVSASIESHKSLLDNSFEELSDSLESSGQQLSQKMEEQVQAANDSADEALKQLQEQLAKAEEIVGAITERGLISGYQKSARRAGRAKNFWYAVTAVSLGALIWYAVKMVGNSEGELDPTVVLARVLITLSFLGLAGFGAKVADRYRKTEDRHRKAEFELAAIAPYLSSLPIEKQNELKAELARKFFGQPLESPAARTGNFESTLTLGGKDLKEIVSELLERWPPKA